MSRRGRTPPFRGPGGEVLADSIAEIDWVRLGGMEQWVLIRGENVANPPLVLLYGGPGLSETYFFRRFNAPLNLNLSASWRLAGGVEMRGLATGDLQGPTLGLAVKLGRF